MTKRQPKPARAPKSPPKPPGRPSAFRPEYVLIARKVARLGATEDELADVLSVSAETLARWKKTHPEFGAAVRSGKLLADLSVGDRLFERAVGYSHKAVKILAVDGKIHKVEYVEHYPPDTQAAIFWLKNRRRADWRDKHEVELSGTVDLADRVRRARARGMDKPEERPKG